MNSSSSDSPDSDSLKATILVEGLAEQMQDAANLLRGGLEPPLLSFDHRNWQPPAAEHIAQLLPQYEVTGLLGRGGMGAVYRGRQPELKRDIAIKILPLEVSADEAFAARFRREAQALARLQHPNIVGIYDFGQTCEGHLFFVMEFVGGADLHRIIHHARPEPDAEGNRVPPGGLTYRQALEIVAQICDALQYAHDEGIIHRDIKPANILLDLKGRVKVADFGLARPLMQWTDTGAATLSSVIMGTMGYMSPEALQGQPVDHRTDIYALGALFYEMLTGQVPAGVFEPPSHKVQLDVRLDEIVIRALQQEPEKRYQQAREMRTAVDTVRLPATPAPAPTPLPERTEPRRTGWGWTAGAAIIVAALFAVWHFGRIGEPTPQTTTASKAAAAAPSTAELEAVRNDTLDAAITELKRLNPEAVTAPEALKHWKVSGQKGEPPGSIKFQGRSYALVMNAVSWEDAAALAESVAGHLASITSEEEDEFIAREFVAKFPATKGLWLGGSDARTEGRWEWTTGEPFEWKNWQPGQPSAKPNQNRLMYDAAEDGFAAGWNDTDGSQPAPFLIEWPAP